MREDSYNSMVIYVPTDALLAAKVYVRCRYSELVGVPYMIYIYIYIHIYIYIVLKAVNYWGLGKFKTFIAGAFKNYWVFVPLLGLSQYHTIITGSELVATGVWR